MMGWGYWAGPGNLAFMVVWVVFWVLVVGAIVLAVRAFWRPQAHFAPPGDAALEILRERYARGEITREQFEEMRRDLTSR